ncbi:MAG: FtsX-like permease family protein [Planctomycetota bacterium]
MRPAWRLAMRNLRAKPKRTLLLVSAVSLSALLIAAVATAMASIQGSIQERVGKQIGVADIKIQGRGTGQTIDARWVERAREWPGVAAAAARVREPLNIRATIELWRPTHANDPEGEHILRTVQTVVTAMGHGVEPAADEATRSLTSETLVEGRLPQGADEIAIDTLLADRLAGRRGQAGAFGGAVQQRDVLVNEADGSAAGSEPVPAADAIERNERVTVGIGDTIELLTGVFRVRAEPFTVVGIVEPPPLGGRPQAFLNRVVLAEFAGDEGRVSEVDILLDEGVDPDGFAEARRAELSEQQRSRLLIQTTAKITSNLEDNLRTGRIGMIFATVLAFLAASFIIMTGLTVDVADRQRELAILRCIGGSRPQLAESQLMVGAIIGGLGALIGTPLGLAGCALLIWYFQDVIRTGLIITWWPIVMASAGSVASGVVGAAWPAYKASSTSPLRAMSPRAIPTTRGPIVLTSVLALSGVVTQLLVVGLPENGSVAFYLYMLIGLPGMFVGYFLLGVPMTLITVRVLGPLIARGLALPRRLLERTVGQTPYRFGFTSGAMMTGLALMIMIWTHGGSIGRDFLASFEFPDAFVSGTALSPEARQKLEELEFVEGTAAISIVPVKTELLGVTTLTSYTSSFIAFEPEPFFELAELTWVEGSEETAKPKLIAGGAVIIAREFQLAQGLGVGDTFDCEFEGEPHEFEIVGVVTSPGLEIVSKFFNIGEEYTQQAIHAVFGSRNDMVSLFGVDTINLIQVELDDGVDDEVAVETMRRTMLEGDYGFQDAGSGRAIKEQLMTVFGGAIGAFSAVAVCSMLVACLGVANLIIAGIDQRRFEFGVLRALGAQAGVLFRLAIGEAVVIAVGAMVLGTLMGLQASWAQQRMHRMLLGLDLKLVLPLDGALLGWSAVAVITVAAAIPAGLGIMRARPRDLLASRG